MRLRNLNSYFQTTFQIIQSGSNLLALAKLFGVPAEELLRETAAGGAGA